MKLSLKSYRTVIKSKSRLVPFLLCAFLAAAVLALLFFFVRKKVDKMVHSTPSVTMLSDKWKEYDYQAVFDTSSVLLEKKPFNNAVLTYRGYAAFYLAVSATESQEAQDCIEEAIRSLRLALMKAKKKTRGQVEYMLGKSYFYKDLISSYHYYADLAVEHLAEAQRLGYQADDIAEYLGLSYAQLGMTMESIAAFSEALLHRESDALLLSIAEQYAASGQNAAAKQYLFQVMQRTSDDSIAAKSRALLGSILLQEGDYDGAKKEFDAILETNENSAEAHYGLGLVYEGKGDLVRARAEWRRTLRIQVNHAEALEKIQQYR